MPDVYGSPNGANGFGLSGADLFLVPNLPPVAKSVTQSPVE